MNEEDLRDCFAMFAMCGMLSREPNGLLQGKGLCRAAYDYADSMLEARKPKEEVGIAAVKRTRKAK